MLEQGWVPGCGPCVINLTEQWAEWDIGFKNGYTKGCKAHIKMLNLLHNEKKTNKINEILLLIHPIHKNL